MKKRFLELMCLSAGLVNISVKTYRTDGADGQYRIAIGYIVKALNANGDLVVNVETPEGFNDAVSEVMEQIYKSEVVFRTEHNYKV